MENNALIAKDYVGEITNSESVCYCSMKVGTLEDKKTLYNCISDPKYRLADEINKDILVKNVYIESVECKRPDESVEVCPRIVLIDADGEGHQCVSFGVYNALKKIFGLMGDPQQWENPLKLTVKQVTKGERKMLNLIMK